MLTKSIIFLFFLKIFLSIILKLKDNSFNCYKKLGEGSFGTVYKCLKICRKESAIKIMKKSENILNLNKYNDKSKSYNGNSVKINLQKYEIDIYIKKNKN